MLTTVIFDWKRTLYDPNNKKLIDGATELLMFLKSKNIELILIGKGDFTMSDETDRLEVKHLFKKVIFREGSKTVEQFQPHISTPAEQTVVVGDRVRSEIEIGNTLSAQTIWIAEGKFADELPLNEMQKPTYKVNSLFECIKIFQELTS